MTKRSKFLILLLCAFFIVSVLVFPSFADEPVADDNAEVVEPEIIAFNMVRRENAKTAYLEGEYFDDSGFVGILSYSDGTNQYVYPGQFTYRETGPLTRDITYISFSYLTFEKSFPITVIPVDEPEPEKEAVSVEFSSSKTEFLAYETIDPSIFTATLIYSDGTIEPLDLSLCSIFPSITDPVSAYTKNYTLSYNNGTSVFTDSIDVTVSPIILLEVSGLENVKLYECTPYAPPSGLTVTAYYNGMKTVSQVITDYTVTSDSVVVTPNDQGKTKITITVDSATVEAEVEVLPIVNYSITAPKTTFYYGETFSVSDIKVTAFYSDMTSYDVSDQVVWNAPEIVVADSKISAVHNGFDLKDFLNFSLPAGTLSVVTPPAKLHYEIGETFDSAGLSVGINYSDGNRRMLSAGEYELIVSTPLTAADKNVILSYYGATANISISVGDEAYIVSLNLAGVPEVMTYFEGSHLNTSGIVIEAYMSDGSKIIVDPRILTFVPALDAPLTTDITEVRISANDGTDKYCEISFPITVKEKLPTALVATSQPYKLQYAEGEIFNPDGLALTLFFNDGSTIIPSSYSFSPELGKSIILVSNATEKHIIYAIYEYEGTEYSYPIEITVTPAEIENIFVSRQPIKTEYEIGEEFIPMGIELMLIYKDRTLMYQIVPEGYYTYSPTVITEDTTEIVFSFRGITVSLPITVNGVDSSDTTTEPIEPPVTDPIDTPDTGEITTEPPEVTDEVTTEPTDITTETEPITSDPDDPISSTPNVTSSPDIDSTSGSDVTSVDTQGGNAKDSSSLLYLWIIIIAVIITALIVLIIYYKKNFT